MEYELILYSIVVAILAIISFYMARKAFHEKMDKHVVAMLVFVAVIDILNSGVTLILKGILLLLRTLS